MSIKPFSNLTSRQIALLLQDAFWYADRAIGNKECFYDISRGQALKVAFSKARDAGLQLSTTLFPRTLSSALPLQQAIGCADLLSRPPPATSTESVGAAPTSDPRSHRP